MVLVSLSQLCSFQYIPVLFISLAFSVPTPAQTTAELQDFNAAYLQYGNTLESNPALAREAARRALTLGRELFGADNERTAMLAINYGNLLPDQAQTQIYLDEAVTIYQTIFGFGSERMIDPLMRLGRTLSDTDRYRLAMVYYDRALQLAISNLGEQSSKAGAIHLELGSIAATVQDLPVSFMHLQRAQEILPEFSDPGSVTNLARSNLLLGDYYLRSEQFASSLIPLLTALQTFSAYPNADVTLRNRIALIEAYEKLGRREEATVHCLAIGVNRRIRPDTNLRPLYSVIPAVELVDGTPSQQYGVRVAFTVDADGFVTDPILMSSISSDVITALFLNAISQFRFAPRFVDGQAVESPNQQFVFSY